MSTLQHPLDHRRRPARISTSSLSVGVHTVHTGNGTQIMSQISVFVRLALASALASKCTFAFVVILDCTDGIGHVSGLCQGSEESSGYVCASHPIRPVQARGARSVSRRCKTAHVHCVTLFVYTRLVAVVDQRIAPTRRYCPDVVFYLKEK